MNQYANLCKIYGSMIVTDSNGKKVKWVYDYAQDKPRIEKEMSKEEIALSEKTKWMGAK